VSSISASSASVAVAARALDNGSYHALPFKRAVSDRILRTARCSSKQQRSSDRLIAKRRNAGVHYAYKARRSRNEGILAELGRRNWIRSPVEIKGRSARSLKPDSAWYPAGKRQAFAGDRWVLTPAR